MTYPESEFLDCLTLARQYDVCRAEIRNTLNRFLQLGYNIPTLAWGKQHKLKIHAASFRHALFAEYTREKNNQ